MKRTSLVLLAALTVSALIPAAAAATTSKRSQAASIVISALKLVAGEKTSQLNADIAGANAATQPCLASFEAIGPTTSSAAANAAVQPLLLELFASYSALALNADLTALSGMATHLATLEHGDRGLATAQIKGLLGFSAAATHPDFCTDYTAWSAAGFAPASEPSATSGVPARSTNITAAENALSQIGRASNPLEVNLSSSQAKQLKSLAARAFKDLNSASNRAQAALEALSGQGG